jgi:hypothetical protein
MARREQADANCIEVEVGGVWKREETADRRHNANEDKPKSTYLCK